MTSSRRNKGELKREWPCLFRIKQLVEADFQQITETESETPEEEHPGVSMPNGDEDEDWPDVK